MSSVVFQKYLFRKTLKVALYTMSSVLVTLHSYNTKLKTQAVFSQILCKKKKKKDNQRVLVGDWQLRSTSLYEF
jgi:hypothetical protein